MALKAMLGRRAPKYLCVGAGKKKEWVPLEQRKLGDSHSVFSNVYCARKNEPWHRPAQAGSTHGLFVPYTGEVGFQVFQSYPIFISL